MKGKAISERFRIPPKIQITSDGNYFRIDILDKGNKLIPKYQRNQRIVTTPSIHPKVSYSIDTSQNTSMNLDEIFFVDKIHPSTKSTTSSYNNYITYVTLISSQH